MKKSEEYQLREKLFRIMQNNGIISYKGTHYIVMGVGLWEIFIREPHPDFPMGGDPIALWGDMLDEIKLEA